MGGCLAPGGSCVSRAQQTMTPGRNLAIPDVAVIGCGYWGRNLVRNFHELGALEVLCDANPAVATQLAEEIGVRTAGLGEILADPAISAIVIAAPAALHFDLSSQALQAGKHVFVEKPLALRVPDAEMLCQLADRVERVLMVGHLLQYHPAYLRLRRLIDDGELGRVQYIYSNRLNLGRIRREEDILWSFAPHDISMILGIVRSEPEAVWAVGGAYLHQSIADVTTTHIAFPGGERAHVFVSWLHPEKEQRLVVVGDRGMAIFNDGEGWAEKLLVYRHRIDWREGMPQPVRALAERIPVEASEPLRLECEHFLTCVRDGSTPWTDGLEGTRVLRVLQAASESMQDQRPPRVDRHQRKDIFVHESSYVEEGCQIGAGTRIWHFSHVLAGSRIGADCTLGQNVAVGPDAVIGDRCKIQNNVSVYKGVTLGDDVFCGPSCVFTNVINPRAHVDRRSEFRATTVGRGATLGANSTILCGTEIGAYAFVAAGAVVTKDVSPHALVVGVPAVRVGWVSHDGLRLGADLRCPRSGRQYREKGPEELEEVR